MPRPWSASTAEYLPAIKIGVPPSVGRRVLFFDFGALFLILFFYYCLRSQLVICCFEAEADRNGGGRDTLATGGLQK